MFATITIRDFRRSPRLGNRSIESRQLSVGRIDLSLRQSAAEAAVYVHGCEAHIGLFASIRHWARVERAGAIVLVTDPSTIWPVVFIGTF